MADYVRITDLLNSYWDGLAKVDGVPKEDDIDASQLNPIWDDCYLVNIRNGEPYKYEYLGKNLIEAYGDEVSHSEVEMLVYPSVKKVADNFNQVVDTRNVFEDLGEFINVNNMLIKYRQLLLPFGDQNGRITHILGGMRWRPF